MVDLVGQYQKIKKEIDDSIQSVINSARFIKGPIVEKFENNLAKYLNVKHVISCANGTDALQISLMALDLKEGDEIIVPAFTYAATAEVIALLNLKPVMVDVDPKTFNVNLSLIEKAVTPKTKVILPVHLFGQCSDMEDILEFAKRNNITIIEDNAQSIGAYYQFKDGTKQRAGTIGDIGTTSFFPSKNLGCFGDGGAIYTNNSHLAEKIRMICNHGQEKKYHHTILGVNSRLDSVQAAVLNVKLRYLDAYIEKRQQVAKRYDDAFSSIASIDIPFRQLNSTHTFHQYTFKVKNGKRNELKQVLKDQRVPSMIYYPIPLYRQKAYKGFVDSNFTLQNTEQLCSEVISIPIHTEMDAVDLNYVINAVKYFYN